MLTGVEQCAADIQLQRVRFVEQDHQRFSPATCCELFGKISPCPATGALSQYQLGQPTPRQ